MAPRVPGELLEDRYRLVEPLGQGGMGSVWVAEQLRVGRRVALKVLRPEFAEDRTAVERLRREASTASRIGNPHIVSTLDFGAAPDGAPFLVLELLEGETLFQALEAAGRFSVARTADVLCQVLSGLAAAHAAGVVHRDLKPENVFLTRFGGRPDFVKLLDFGLALVRAGETGTRLTRTGVMLGTPSYMAPEQVLGRSDVDHRADLWAAGVILFRALAGRKPFEGPSVAERVAAVVSGPIPRLRDWRPDLPPDLDAVVTRALQRDPARRFASAEEFAAALAPHRPTSHGTFATRVAEPRSSFGLPGPPSVPPNVPVVRDPAVPSLPAPPPARRASWLIPVGLLVAVVAGVGGALLLHRLSRGGSEQAPTGEPRPTGEMDTGSPPAPQRLAPADGADGTLDLLAVFVAVQADFECGLPELLSEPLLTPHRLADAQRAQYAAHGVSAESWLPIFDRFAHDPAALDALARAVCRCANRQPDPTSLRLPLLERVLAYYAAQTCRAAESQDLTDPGGTTRRFQQADLESKCAFGVSTYLIAEAAKEPGFHSKVAAHMQAASLRCRTTPQAAATEAALDRAAQEDRARYVHAAIRMACESIRQADSNSEHLPRPPDAGDLSDWMSAVLEAEGLDWTEYGRLSQHWALDRTTIDEVARGIERCFER